MEKVIELINKKLSEHKLEIEATGDYKTTLKSKIVEGQEQLKKKSGKMAETAIQILALNDKVSFHQAAIKVLEDLKKDIVGG